MPDFDFSTVILALVALFVVFKLRSVLGTRNGSERPSGGLLAPLRRASGPAPAIAPADALAPATALPAAPVDRWKGLAEPDAWTGLDAIVVADRSFAGPDFLSGARAAYYMVVHGFAAGDAATLRNLIAPEAFANFDAAIRARAVAGQTTTTTVVSIDSAEIVGAQLTGTTAQISVRFATKLNSVTRDSAGAIVDGSPTEVADHVDLWTFVRDIRSRDPNWQLTATESEH